MTLIESNQVNPMERQIQLKTVQSIPSKFFDKKALMSKTGSLTYRELIAIVNKYSRSLYAKSKPEEIIGVYMDRSIEMVISILSIFNSGCVFLPINPNFPKSRIEYLVQNSKIRKIITSNELKTNLSELGVEVFTLDFLANEATEKTVAPIHETQLAYLMYTSGSTGNPKGVLVEHKSLENAFHSVKNSINLTADDVFLALTDFTFDISLLELILPLTIGASVVVADSGTICNGEKIKFYIDAFHPTIIQATPLTWDILLKSGWKNDGSIKIISGGEALSSNLAQKLDLKHENVWNMYGPTETTIWSTIAHLNASTCLFSVPIGNPINNTQIYILDANLNEVKTGEIGMLYIGGIGLARGYCNNDSLTDESFITHPKHKERLYKTNDLVKINSEGSLIYIGRADDQIKIGGIRLEPKEVENSVESLDCIKKAVLIKKSSSEYCKQLILYVESNGINQHTIKYNDISLIKSWKSAYNAVYRESPKLKESMGESPGWISAFKGKSLSQAELDESIKLIISTVQTMDNPDILEVGCGIGNLTLKVIDYSSKYTAIDCSEEAIKILSDSVNPNQKRKLTLEIGFANNVCDKSQYDCIIMHSVAQYFPSEDYFEDVLSKLILACRSNGTIILSDLRDPSLLDIFLLEKFSYESDNPDTSCLEKFYLKNRDNELLINPEYFSSLSSRYDSVSHVDIAVRQGKFDNELNNFRYDVIIHVNKPLLFNSPIEIMWNDSINEGVIDETLNKHQNTTVILTKIPNIPVINKINKLSKIFPKLSSDLMLNTTFITALEQDRFNSLVEMKFPDRETFIQYQGRGDYLELQMLFHPKQPEKIIRPSNQAGQNIVKNIPYFREPFNLWAQNIIFERISDKLNKDIPKCIHPSSIVWIEKWPSLINGKIDKKKLSMFNCDYNSCITNKTAALIYGIWFEITGRNISIDDNLFYANMSSLYSHYFLASISEKFSINILFHEFMEHPSIRELANLIENKLSEDMRRAYKAKMIAE